MAPLSFAVFGHPIKHSVSPPIHRAFAEQFGIALEYRAIDAAPAEFNDAVQQFFADAGRGANVTLPHKAAAFALADERSEAATRVGTANVLTRLPDGRLAAHNTDGAGMVRDMTERHGIALRSKSVLMLGAGGAARGVAWNLLDAGVQTLTIVNRSRASADALAGLIDDAERVQSHDWQQLAELGCFDLIVHATSAGVLGEALPLPTSLVDEHTIGYDLSYGAAAAGFLAWAKSAGARQAVDGLGMLLETAADTFALWHGQRPQTEPVYQSMRRQTA
ncbi:shikimate dehydrogenase [Rhodanobacter sp. ANJX3]|uniref:shikimate dehydrogenase n=1 Tax=Rhodanobacter sp. ANJX3 TaxID=2723083 RepID=UPI0016200326|nr:shikimate dehydrogenase [Rhodanobacter sp. ANJX3]MBB5359617.1 shikimate dehydrogenase [Rhodanobacter sp. ANJX3]